MNGEQGHAPERRIGAESEWKVTWPPPGDARRYGKNMKYHERQIEKLYLENLAQAGDLLASLPVTEGRKPTTKGLNGSRFWMTSKSI